MARPSGPTPLAELKPRDVQASVRVLVVRKWNFTGRKENGPILHVDLILADKQGNVMYAEIPRDEVDDKSPLIEAGHVYTISRFRVKGAKYSYMPVRGPNMIEFTYYTRVVPVNDPPDTYPQHVYTVVPFDQIHQHVREHPDFIDVIGIITKVQPPLPMRLPGQPTSTMTRDIFIKDLQDNDLRLTLWGQRSAAFSVSHMYDSDNPRAIVALFVGCVPKEFQKTVHVTGNNACHWYLNPPIPEAQPYYDRYCDQRFPLHLPPSSPEHPREEEETIVIEHKSLEELNAIDPYDFPQPGFHCTVTVTAVPQDSSWWYLGCRVCKKSSPDQVGGAPWCGDCSSSDFKPRYKLSFTATDATGEGSFFCFDAIARQIVKKSCEALLQLPNKTAGAPPALAAIVGNRYKFAIGLTSESYHSKARAYQVNSIMEDFQRVPPAPRLPTVQAPAQLPTLPSTSAVGSAVDTTPRTSTTSSILIDALPIESPTPPESKASASHVDKTPSATPASHATASTTKISVVPEIAGAFTQYSSNDPMKSPRHTDKTPAQRKLFDDQASDEQDHNQSSDPPRQSPPKPPVNSEVAGQDKDADQLRSDDTFNHPAKRPRTEEPKGHGMGGSRKSASGSHKK